MTELFSYLLHLSKSQRSIEVQFVFQENVTFQRSCYALRKVGVHLQMSLISERGEALYPVTALCSGAPTAISPRFEMLEFKLILKDYQW